MPDISIIVPSFNQGTYLPTTLQSILCKDQPPNLQVIVIDGASTDNTVDYLRTMDDPRVTWVSEPDRGQAHAINKGMAMARGNIVAWLNSDDLYEPGALHRVREAFQKHPEAQWLTGRTRMVDDRGREVRRGIRWYKDWKLRHYRYSALLRVNFISQMSTFWRREFGQHLGPLDESLYYAMDYDFWLRAAAHCDPLIIHQALARFRWHPHSKTAAVNRRQYDEQYQVALPHLRGRPCSRILHRIHVEQIVWTYRLLRWFGE